MIMKSFWLILIFLSGIIIQTSLVPFLGIKGGLPNLILLLALWLTLNQGFSKVWFWLVLAGFFLEMSSGLLFGLNSLSLLTAVYLIDLINRKVFSGHKFWINVLLIFLGSLFYNLILIGLIELAALKGESQTFLSFKEPWAVMALSIFYNLIIFILFYGAKKVFYQKPSQRKH